ncbi:MAG: hypothetical protein B7Y39_01260 [Bdellovibrio sp. 28-41-41]|nr:MAG: hypothetical protein B7Y39_01260 [Bdellovibrio sp. 28-41-41]
MEAVRLIRNAHHILGLQTGVDIQGIRKRANHLLNLARIDESEKYETDLTEMSDLRTEQNIRKAVEQLSGVKTRLIEAFFWFETPTLQDFSSLKALSKGDYDNAIKHWKSLSSTSPNWIAKKNEALSYFIAAQHTNDKNLFNQSITLWKEIELSDQFWLFYKEHYKLTDDLGTNEASFVEIRTKLFEYLSWLTLDLYRNNFNKEYISIFFKQTGIVGQGIENHILAPVISKVRSEMDTISIEKDDIIKLRTKKLSVISLVQDLSDFGVDDYSPVKALRETCATKFRNFSVAIYNEKENIDLSKEYLQAAVVLSSSNSFLLQAERDKAQLESNHAFESFISKVASKSEGKSTREKWNIFLHEEATLPESIKKGKGYTQLKGQVLLGFCVEEFTQALKNLNANGMQTAFHEIWNNIDLFELNKEKVLEMAKELEAKSKLNSSVKQFQKIDEDNRLVGELADNSKLEENAKGAFLILCRSALWKEAIPHIHYHKFDQNVTKLAFFVGIIVWANSTWYLGIGAWIVCIYGGSFLGKKIYLK